MVLPRFLNLVHQRNEFASNNGRVSSIFANFSSLYVELNSPNYITQKILFFTWCEVPLCVTTDQKLSGKSLIIYKWQIRHLRTSFSLTSCPPTGRARRERKPKPTTAIVEILVSWVSHRFVCWAAGGSSPSRGKSSRFRPINMWRSPSRRSLLLFTGMRVLSR